MACKFERITNLTKLLQSQTVKCPNNFDLHCSQVAIAQNSIFLAKSRKKGMRKMSLLTNYQMKQTLQSL